MSFKHDWNTGDYAYIIKDTLELSECDVFKVTAVGVQVLGRGTDEAISRSVCAPVLRGRDLPPMPYGGRLARVFSTIVPHGQTFTAPSGWEPQLTSTYAVLEVFDAPDPNKEKIRALRETIETAQQQIRELEEA